MSSEIYIGKSSIKIPPYITSLTQEEINNIIMSKLNLEDKIIAAGVHPKDGKVTLILPTGIVMLFDADSYYIPRGRYVPNPSGETIFLPNENSRWPNAGLGFTIESKWIISQSVSAFSEVEFLLNNKSLGIMNF